MKVTAYKTKKIVAGDKLFPILDQYLPKLHEKEVVAISSKIVSITQGRLVKNDGKISKAELVKKEADLILPEKYVRFGIHLTIKNNSLIGSAGIDESNGDGYFILWPENLRVTTNGIWKYLKKRHKLKYLGVVITDSHSSLFRRGTVGFSLSWCGFKPLRNYIGKPDVFGRLLQTEKQNLADSLAAAAILAMGEGNEQTPLAVINDLKGMEFVDRAPNRQELDETTLDLETDVYSGPMKTIEWEKGKS